MTARLADLGRLVSSRWPVVYAAAIAVAILVFPLSARETGVAWLGAMLALAALLVRQVDHPVEGSAVTVAIVAVATLAARGRTGDVWPTFTVGLGPALCVGRLCPRPQALTGLGVLCLGLPATQLLAVHPDAGVLSGLLLYVLPPWLLGRAVRSRALLVAELRRVNEELVEQRRAGEAAAVVRERAQVARELHDVVAHAVSLMVLQAAGARLSVFRAPEASIGALQVVEQAGAEAVREMERLFAVLNGDAASPGVGLAGLDVLVHKARGAGLAVEVVTQGPLEGLRPAVDLAVFRIVQEALTNAVRHAAPTTARLSLHLRAGVLEVVLEDDGPPPSPPRQRGTGNGLLGIQERVDLLGGTLTAGVRKGGGFGLHVQLPVALAQPTGGHS
ncbi:MAG: two component system sensor kinase [Frankiales bacterium]|nr:two component system sensor kinase [Frankiales bacterium]